MLRICLNTLRPGRCIRRGPLLCRSVHHRSMLPYPIEHGLGEFLPPPALKTVAIEYQEDLLKRLNEEVRGTDYAYMSVSETVIAASKYKRDALTFNLASMALNNHFFLDQLKPVVPLEDENGKVYATPENHQHEISPQLRSNIEGQYGSLAQFKSTFSAAALGMFSSGYVWLVTDQAGRLAVIPTFGAGSLLVRARAYGGPTDSLTDLHLLADDLRTNDPYRAELEAEMERDQENVKKFFEDMETSGEMEKLDQEEQQESSLREDESETSMHEDISLLEDILSKEDVDELRLEAEPPTLPTGRREYHTSAPRRAISDPAVFDPAGKPYDIYTKDELPEPDVDRPWAVKNAQLGDVLYPLLCVSVHEHGWMSAGFGVCGKEEWLKKFWDVVDWERVSSRFEELTDTLVFDQEYAKEEKGNTKGEKA